MKMAFGFNVEWSVGAGRVNMTPAAGLAALRQELQQGQPKQPKQLPQQAAQKQPAPVHAPAQEAAEAAQAQHTEKQQKQQPQVSVATELEALVSEVREVAAAAAAEHAAPAGVAAATAAALAANAVIVHHHQQEPAAAAAPPPPSPPPQPATPATPAAAANIVGDSPVHFDVHGSGSWLQASFMVPPEAYGERCGWDGARGCRGGCGHHTHSWEGPTAAGPALMRQHDCAALTAGAGRATLFSESCPDTERCVLLSDAMGARAQGKTFRAGQCM